MVGKVLTRPHTPAREMQSPAREMQLPAREMQSPVGKLRVAGVWMIFWFRCLHKSWRSPLGAPSGMVGVGKRCRRKSLPAVSVF